MFRTACRVASFVVLLSLGATLAAQNRDSAPAVAASQHQGESNLASTLARSRRKIDAHETTDREARRAGVATADPSTYEEPEAGNVVTAGNETAAERPAESPAGPAVSQQPVDRGLKPVRSPMVLTLVTLRAKAESRDSALGQADLPGIAVADPSSHEADETVEPPVEPAVQEAGDSSRVKGDSPIFADTKIGTVPAAPVQGGLKPVRSPMVLTLVTLRARNESRDSDVEQFDLPGIAMAEPSSHEVDETAEAPIEPAVQEAGDSSRVKGDSPIFADTKIGTVPAAPVQGGLKPVRSPMVLTLVTLRARNESRDSDVEQFDLPGIAMADPSSRVADGTEATPGDAATASQQPGDGGLKPVRNPMLLTLITLREKPEQMEPERKEPEQQEPDGGKVRRPAGKSLILAMINLAGNDDRCAPGEGRIRRTEIIAERGPLFDAADVRPTVVDENVAHAEEPVADLAGGERVVPTADNAVLTVSTVSTVSSVAILQERPEKDEPTAKAVGEPSVGPSAEPPTGQAPDAGNRALPETVAEFLRQTPITDLTTDIRPKDAKPENLPRDWAAERAGKEPVAWEALTRRGWGRVCYQWEASGLCHQPLYFEETNLERYGYSVPYLRVGQPLLSAAHFFGTLPLMPYMMVAQPVGERVYVLGQYRPGSQVPYQYNYPPLKPVAGLTEASVVTGLFFLIP